MSLKQTKQLALTSDCWTNTSMAGWQVITCHYFNEHGKLTEVMLDIIPLPPSHTADVLEASITGVLKDYDIENKLCSIITDNAMNMVAATREIGHAGCVCHKLQLCVTHTLWPTGQSPLMIVLKNRLTPLISKCRSLVSHIRHSSKLHSELRALLLENQKVLSIFIS